MKEITLEEIEDFRSDKPTMCEVAQYRMLSSITDEDISKAPLYARVTSVAILEDKIRLMRGQPTSIHLYALVDVLEALRVREGE
jgi:hypothetical protein